MVATPPYLQHNCMNNMFTKNLVGYQLDSMLLLVVLDPMTDESPLGLASSYCMFASHLTLTSVVVIQTPFSILILKLHFRHFCQSFSAFHSMHTLCMAVSSIN